MNRLSGTLLLLLLAATPLAGEPAPLPPWSRQIEIRDAWLEKRHSMLLEMMRRHDIDMWIVVNEEFHDDPLTHLVAPARPYAGNRDIFVFADAGEKGLARHAIVGYAEESVQRFFEAPDDPKPAREALPLLFERYDPERIGLGIGGGRGVTRSLTYDTRLFLEESMGPKAAARFVSAADLIEEYLDTRIPEELELYRSIVERTDSLVRRALSNEVITPGKTTVGDVRRWLYDELWNQRLTTWFQPDIRVQRRGMKNDTSRGFLAVSPETIVIQRGDILHIDFGISFMGLHSDWQKMAYVLREGETAPPAGLTRALKNTNTLQDALMTISRPGKTNAEVYQETMRQMEEAGIQAQIYSHPLGNQGHALGASIDFRSARRENAPAPKRLRKGSYIAIELNTLTPVKEWDDQPLYVMQEDPAHLTDDGWKFFVPRQEAYYLVR